MGIRKRVTFLDINPYTNQSAIAWTPQTKSLLPSLYEREEFPPLEKRGQGRFSEDVSN
jgi:hypothetical protein